MKMNIALVTYNHEKFIREALDGILMQKTDFEFNIIVADDCSTDSTIDIIKEYATGSSVEFLFLEAKENLGITKNYQRVFTNCNGEYIAVIEGDDIWTDPYRLQKHADFLDRHFECTMTFNRFIIAQYEDAIFYPHPALNPNNGYQLITSREIAHDNIIGNFSACVYRKSALSKLPLEMFELTSYDWITNILVGSYGMIGYLSDIMSIYRKHSNGVWSGKKEEENLRKMLVYIEQYDTLTNGVFHHEFNDYKNRVEAILRNMRPKEIISNVVSPSKVRCFLKSIKEYTPPIFIIIAKAIVPPKIWNKIGG